MNVADLIARKRDAKALSSPEISFIAQGLADGAIDDAQAGALAMAILLNGMSDRERVDLTLGMRDSGAVMSWDFAAPVIDKHSTGGVGDCTSLLLAPALAACGAYVPMISGRGLGHTGGTLDKFDAIPGYQTSPDIDTFRKVTRDVGCAIVGQTADVAPADRRLYAIRDVTATVESIDLICASILSKKLAAGLDALVLDVKTGNGAFMADPKEAETLARALSSVATGAGCPTTALITDMNEPLMPSAGNALEVAAAIKFLRGDEIDSRIWDVTCALGGEVLASAKLAKTPELGSAMIAEQFQNGSAAERFAQMVTALGGPSDLLDNADRHLPRANVVVEVTSEQTGFVDSIDTRALGMTVVEMGGGRLQVSDAIDPSVGLQHMIGIGMLVEADTPLALIHAADEASADKARVKILSAYSISDTPQEPAPLIRKRISA